MYEGSNQVQALKGSKGTLGHKLVSTNMDFNVLVDNIA